MNKQLRLGGEKIKTAYWSLVGTASAMIVSMQPVFAATIWDRFSTIMQDIYGELVLKRIVVTWIVINSLGFVVAYLQPLIAGGNYSPGGGGAVQI